MVFGEEQHAAVQPFIQGMMLLHVIRPMWGRFGSRSHGFHCSRNKNLISHSHAHARSKLSNEIASCCVSSTSLKCILFRRIRERRYTLWSGTFYMLYFAEHIYKHIHTFINVLEQWKSYTLMHERGKFPIQVLPDFSLPLTHVAAFCLCQRDTVFLAKPKWTLVSWCLSTMYIFCWGPTYTYSIWI